MIETTPGLLFVLFMLLASSAFFSGSETAFMSISNGLLALFGIDVSKKKRPAITEAEILTYIKMMHSSSVSNRSGSTRRW
jgi:Mg2+/Co2+ transporter CorB